MFMISISMSSVTILSFSLLDTLYDQLNLNAGQVALLERTTIFDSSDIARLYHRRADRKLY